MQSPFSPALSYGRGIITRPWHALAKFLKLLVGLLKFLLGSFSFLGRALSRLLDAHRLLREYMAFRGQMVNLLLCSGRRGRERGRQGKIVLE